MTGPGEVCERYGHKRCAAYYGIEKQLALEAAIDRLEKSCVVGTLDLQN